MYSCMCDGDVESILWQHTKNMPGTTLCRVSSKGCEWVQSSVAEFMSYFKMRNISVLLWRHGLVRFRFCVAYIRFIIGSAGFVLGYLFLNGKKSQHSWSESIGNDKEQHSSSFNLWPTPTDDLMLISWYWSLRGPGYMQQLTRVTT